MLFYVCYITRYVYVMLDNMLCYVIIMLRYITRYVTLHKMLCYVT